MNFPGKNPILLFLAMAVVSCNENVNPPEVSDQEFSVHENASAGTIIGVVDAYDLDPGQALSYEILDGNEAGTFGIDSVSGHLTVEDPALLDFESNREISFTVVVADNGDPVMQSTATITITLVDVNEFAPVVEDQVFSIEEGPASGALIGMIEASDQESHQLLLYTILAGNEEEIFALDEESGALTVNDPAAFDFQENPQFVLTVLVRDIHVDSKSNQASITVHVIPK